MIASAEIAPHLPLLRRYARAVTGSQNVGDVLVAATLEAVIAEPSVLEGNASVRVNLHRLLVRIMPGRAAPLDRQAFLLQALEGFSPEDTSYILEIDLARVAALVEQAGCDLVREPSAEVLIIHREPLIAYDLRSVVEELGHHVIGCAQTRAGAMKFADAPRLDLVMTNTILPDGNGIEVARDLLGVKPAALVVVTAFVERFLTGERPEPAFLVAAPFQPSAISAIVSQALFFARNPPVELIPTRR